MGLEQERQRAQLEALERRVSELEAELEAVRLRYARMVDASPMAMLWADPTGRIECVNVAFLDLLGSPSAQATRSINLLTFPPLREAGVSSAAERCLSSGEVISEPILYRSMWGRDIEARITMSPTRGADGAIDGLLLVATDAHGQRIAEEEREEAARMERLEALGSLAVRASHGINNVLGAIVASLDAVEAAPRGDIGDDLEAIRAACERGTELTGQLLGAARRPDEARTFDLAAVVERVIAGLDPRGVKVVRDLEPGMPPIAGDSDQIERALAQLCTNGVDAVVAKGGSPGRLAIIARVMAVGVNAGTPNGIAPGRWIRLQVIDTGGGMTRETLSHAFEPFFTTSGAPGRGLGLWIAYGAVRAHGGTITIDSELGSGTVVTVFLPLRVARSIEGERAPDPDPAGRQSILLVDDEPIVRRTLRRLLERMGHEVVDAASGEEAVEVFDDRRHEIGLVLLDMQLPGIDGLATMAQLRELDPHIPVILSSGDGFADYPEAQRRPGVVGCLVKPFELGALQEAIAKGLSDHDAAP